MSDTFEKVRDVIAQHLDKYPRGITRESKLAKDLGADDLDIVEIVMKLERKFEITIPDSDGDELDKPTATVADVIAIVDKALAS